MIYDILHDTWFWRFVKFIDLNNPSHDAALQKAAAGEAAVDMRTCERAVADRELVAARRRSRACDDRVVMTASRAAHFHEIAAEYDAAEHTATYVIALTENNCWRASMRACELRAQEHARLARTWHNFVRFLERWESAGEKRRRHSSSAGWRGGVT